jgi:hypothetical protein
MANEILRENCPATGGTPIAPGGLMRLSRGLALTLLVLAGCSPSAFDDLRSAVRNDAGPRTVEVGRDAGEADASEDAEPAEAGSGGAAGKSMTSEAGRSGSSSGGRGGAAAGSGGTAGSSGVSGSQAGAGAGSGGSTGGSMQPAAAGSAGMAPSCGDTATDPHHCGTCDTDCGSAASADVSCVASACFRKCRDGFADCNDDLAKGASGDGCEISTTANLANCGACGNVCTPPAVGIPACAKSACLAYTSKIGSPRAVTTTPHGSVGGQAYDQTCPAGEVLVGLDVATPGDIAFGLNALCAPLTIGGPGDAPVFTTGTPHAPNTAVGGIIDPTPPTMRFLCPENTVIAGVAGVTYLWTDGTRTADPAIRSISLACNEIVLDAQHRLVFTPKRVVDIGDRNGEVELYTDMCQPSEVVLGFKGYAGAYIDGLQTYCGAVSVGATPFEGSLSAAK